jgi:hypothetical protein
MSLLSFFKWLEQLPPSTFIRASAWLGAMINVAHLLCLVMLAGAILIVDLRLLGGGMTRQPVAQVARDARPWLIAGLVGMLLTGIPQVLSTAMKQYYSPFFWMKMEFLLVAVIFTFTLKHKVTMADETRVGRFWSALVGLVSIGLWTGAAINARLIGLLS